MSASGVPITSAVCYCDTCQLGSRELAALPDAPPVGEVDGGTAYVLYRRDRISYERGGDLLKPLKIDATTTNRVYAACCNAAMVMRFDDARPWACLYRERFHTDPPALEYRICTKYAPARDAIPTDVPSFAMYPPGFMIKLLTASIATVFDRRRPA